MGQPQNLAQMTAEIPSVESTLFSSTFPHTTSLASLYVCFCRDVICQPPPSSHPYSVLPAHSPARPQGTPAFCTAAMVADDPGFNSVVLVERLLVDFLVLT